jgi:site-specific DNA-methyltransferase (adenine-specific)
MPNIEFYNEDCIELMKRYPDNYFELAIVDPPYGINASKGTWGSSNCGKVKNYGKKTWDNQTPKEQYFFQLSRVSQNQIIWGANHFISKIPFDSSCWIVWDKLNSGDFADCELAWTSFETAVRKFEFRWNGMLQGDMKNKEIRIHPTQKPVALYKWLLKNYAKQGDKILDTHGGSMSSAIACYDMGFDLVITELDKEYFDKAKKRFDDHVSQLSLFTPQQLTI